MNLHRLLLPLWSLRTTFGVLALVNLTLLQSARGSESVGPVAGAVCVMAQGSTIVTNMFVPFQDDLATVFAGHMDGGTNRLDSDRFSWRAPGGNVVEFWKVASQGHALDGLLVVGGLHPPHHGMGKHFEIILRLGGGKNLKVIIPGIKRWLHIGVH